jgi:hypothetical protein
MIEKKLRGIHRTSKDRVEKEVSTSNLVQMLIQEATDNANLVSCYFPLVIMSTSNAYRGKCIPVGLPGIDASLTEPFASRCWEGRCSYIHIVQQGQYLMLHPAPS